MSRRAVIWHRFLKAEDTIVRKKLKHFDGTWRVIGIWLLDSTGAFMAVIVIGGHSRKVGKTSVVAGIIAILPEYRWSAFTITQHRHGLGSTGLETAWEISQETNRSGGSDTSRFLPAGAERAFWVRTEPKHFAEAMPMVQCRLAESKNAIVESNSVLRFLKPDLYLVVIDPDIIDFKPSAQELLDRADAVILHCRPGQAHENWIATLPARIASRTVFPIKPPEYVTAEMVAFVRATLIAWNSAIGR